MSPEGSRKTLVIVGVVAFVIFTCGGVVLAFSVFGAAFFWTSSRTVSGPIAISTMMPLPQAQYERPFTLQTDGTFVFTTFERKRSVKPPAQYAAPVPETLAGILEMRRGEGAHPPIEHVSGLACAGDTATNEALLAASRAAVEAGLDEADIRIAIGGVYDWCEIDEAPCGWLRDRVTSIDPDAVNAPFWHALASCTDDVSVTLLAEDGPTLSYLRSVDVLRRSGRRIGWSKRLEDFAMANALDHSGYYDFRVAVDALGDTSDPRSAKALHAVHALASSTGRKTTVALAMWRQVDDRSRLLFSEVCDGSEDPRCYEEPAIFQARRDVASRLGDPEEPIAAIVETPKDREELLRGLEQCAKEEALGDRAFECHAALALLDWARAKKTPTLKAVIFDELRATLDSEPDRAGVIARLVALGMIDASDPVPPHAVTPRQILLGTVHALAFEGEAEDGSADHPMLLRRLARLAPRDLEGVVFEQLAPPEDLGQPHVVIAYVDGEKLVTGLEDMGEWYEVEGAIGLLNAILVDRGSEMRFVEIFDPDDSRRTVIAGPKKGILEAVEKQLLVIVPPTEGVEPMPGTNPAGRRER